LHNTFFPSHHNTGAQIGVKFTSAGHTSADIDISRINGNVPNTDLGTAGRIQLSGVRLISGLPKGVYTVAQRWKRTTGGTGFVQVDAGDWYSGTVEERF
jgi:hypothetical protein